MTQLIVSLDDTSMLAEVKQAIRMLKGVVSVNVARQKDTPNLTTLHAINELEQGYGVVCEDFDDYLKLVNGDLPD